MNRRTLLGQAMLSRQMLLHAVDCTEDEHLDLRRQWLVLNYKSSTGCDKLM